MLINWALKYAKAGLSIIPLRPKGKEPLIPWTEFQKRKANEKEIREWFKKWPDANIGVITGAISQIAVVDLDGQEGLEQAQTLNLTSNCQSITGNGKHLWFKHPGRIVANSVKKIANRIDIRGDAGFIVAPPSIHENGKRYRWLCVNWDVAKLPVFPMELLKINTNNQMVNGQIIHKEEGWIAKALEEMKDGNIDNTIVSILGRLRHDGYSAEDARAFLSPHMERVKAESNHLEAKIENIWNRYEPKSQAGWVRPMSTNSNLVIHSPTNPDSIKQFEQCVSDLDGQNGETNLKSGYPKLDEYCTGGLKSSRLFTVAALTSHGKTNFGIGLSRNICRQGKKVLYFSTEFTFQKIWQRYIATLKTFENFKDHQFYICDGFTPNIEQVEEAIIQINPDVFIFDYIQHVSKDKDKLTEFMKGCQFLQRKYNLQGVILAQLNRSADWVENGKRITPRMSMIEGSATIEQASSRVLLLSLTQSTPEYHEVTGVLDKNDDGDTGIIHFALYKNPYHLEEI